jgi:hypothetical protein
MTWCELLYNWNQNMSNYTATIPCNQAHGFPEWLSRCSRRERERKRESDAAWDTTLYNVTTTPHAGPRSVSAVLPTATVNLIIGVGYTAQTDLGPGYFNAVLRHRTRKLLYRASTLALVPVVVLCCHAKQGVARSGMIAQTDWYPGYFHSPF